MGGITETDASAVLATRRVEESEEKTRRATFFRMNFSSVHGERFDIEMCVGGLIVFVLLALLYCVCCAGSCKIK